MEDSFMHKGLRRKLVEQVKSKGIKDQRILDAMMKIPRHAFMDSSFLKFAYQDQAFPISSGQTISQPFTVAFQTELIDIQIHQKVLEVGTGSGYQAAILAELGARVFTIERIRKLYQEAQTIHRELGSQVKFFLGDGYQGLPSFAPFDRILITAAAHAIPEALKQQLVVGGILVAPIGERDFQVMTKCVKTSMDIFEISTHGNFVFVPMKEGLE
ncbi:MAG: protein-L-isoaspartate(D-aspartate) O-methyltransferase [Porphyromonadaceae bacterium]|nr:MAG: protein-L-isoaspartate(D-aspartate) O-methyltransferase [Porphyromonadaceae bacterium]